MLAEAASTIWHGVGGVLSLVGAAVFVAVAMEPAVGRLARRMRRGAAAGIVLATSVALFATLVAVGGAVAAQQGRNLLDNLPTIAASIDAQLHELGITTDLAQRVAPGGQVDSFIERIDDWALAASGQAVVLFGQVLAVLFIAFYLSADLPRILRRLCSLVAPRRQAQLVRAWQVAVEKAGGYLYSRAVLALVSMVAHGVAFVIVGLDYPVPLAIWVGVVSQAIPVVGTYLAGVLPVLVALGDRPAVAVVIVIILVVYQQVENLLFAPKITSTAISVHPLTSFLSVLVGAALFGWVGALVAVPLAATLAAFADTSLPRHEVDLQLPSRERRERRSDRP